MATHANWLLDALRVRTVVDQRRPAGSRHHAVVLNSLVMSSGCERSNGFDGATRHDPMITIEVRAAVPYSEIAAQALAALESRPVTVDTRFVRGHVHVSELHIHPSGARLSVAVTVRADLNWPLPQVRGVLNLSATPVYDDESQTLRLSDVSITADVDHVLARAAIAHKRREIIDALNGVSVEVEPLLRDIRDRLNTGLSDHRVAPGIALRGQVETIRVNEILLSEALVVVASASGQLRVRTTPPPLE